LILTSNFKTASHLPGAVAISRGVPRGFVGRRYMPLAPSRKLIKIVNPSQFVQAYRLEVLDKLDPQKVLQDLGGDNFIMLCWESAGEFCHRQMVAAWLRKLTGAVIDEFNPKLRRHDAWLRQMRGGV